MSVVLAVVLMLSASASLALAAPPFPVTFVTQWGTLGSEPGQLRWPQKIAIDGDGNVWVADHGNDRIQKFGNSGAPLLHWGVQGSGDGMMNRPMGIAIGPDGSVYVSEGEFNQRIQKFTPSGAFLAKWGSWGGCDGEFMYPSGLAVDDAGFVYVGDTGNQRVQKFTSDGTFVMKWGSGKDCGAPKEGGISTSGVALTPSGTIVVGGQNYLGEFTTSGVEIWSCSPCVQTGGIAVDPITGNIYSAQGYIDKVFVFSSTGVLLGEFGGSGTGEGQFNFPVGVAVDAYGFVYVGDLHNHRIQKFAPGAATPVKPSTWGRLKAIYR
jgi:DNA-binding beta-propeller fold protein YncE